MKTRVLLQVLKIPSQNQEFVKENVILMIHYIKFAQEIFGTRTIQNGSNNFLSLQTFLDCSKKKNYLSEIRAYASHMQILDFYLIN